MSLTIVCEPQAHIPSTVAGGPSPVGWGHTAGRPSRQLYDLRCTADQPSAQLCPGPEGTSGTGTSFLQVLPHGPHIPKSTLMETHSLP